MKKEQMELKEVIKAAILEAFAEMYGVATMAEGDETGSGSDNMTGPGDKGDGGSNNTGGNNSNNPNNPNNGFSDENSGGTPGNDGRPKPDVGVGVFGLR